MKNWVLWPQAISQYSSVRWPLQPWAQWRRCKPPLCGAVAKPRGNFDYFNDSRFSNSLSMHHSVTKKIIYNYRVTAQKLPMLKQGMKTINAEFIRTCELSQLFFVKFRPYAFVQFRTYANLFPGLFLSLTLMSKSKKNLETSLNLTLSFKTSVDRWCKGQGSYFECGLFLKLAP